MKRPLQYLKSCTCLLVFNLLLSAVGFAQYDVVVAQDGSGNYTTISAAISAAPTGRTTPYRVFIKNGRYREVVTIPANKPFIYLVGESVGNTIITYDNYVGKLIPGGNGATYGTNTTATVFFNSNDCGAFNLSIENAFGYVDDTPQAVAVYISGDRCIFKNVRLNGGQDTLWTNGDGKKAYFRNCYIDGNTDFIFGSMIAVFDSCVIYPRDRVKGGTSGYITAANTPAGQAYGYVFRDCLVPANTGVTRYSLGRPWQNDASTPPEAKKHNKTVFLNSRMSSSIVDTGWSKWNEGTDVSLITYGEYRSRKFDGSLVDVSRRVAWSQQLTDSAAASMYVNSNLFGTWDPCSMSADVCATTSTPLAISNFRGIKGSSNTVFRWNISWPMAGVAMDVYRSTDKVNFSIVNQQTTINDSAVNFTFTEAVPPAGQTYYYYIRSSKDGSLTTTDTVVISSKPTITVSGSMGSFIQGVGTPSKSQSYTVSAVNLLDDLRITAADNYEISLNGTTWNNSSSPIVIVHSGGNVSNTNISVRLNGTAAGTYNGNLIHASTGADTVRLAVTGTVQNDPVKESTVLEWWPLTTSNSDSAAVRAQGVVGTTPNFRNLYLSNGTTVATVPAYSPTHGQAFGASANGDGTWTTGVGGPGSNVSRIHYEQFTITASSAHSVRVDSLILTTAIHNSSNGRFAIAFSKSGFTTNDSTEMPGASFASPITLANQTGAVTVTYRFAFSGASGIALNANESLTFRLYYAVGSGSAGRYAKLKDVIIKGEALGALPLNLITFNGTYTNKQVKLNWNTANEINSHSFIIERSVDARTFKAIGSVEAKNTRPASYSFIDESVLAGVSYYRLKMLDKDGSFKHSKVVIMRQGYLDLFTVHPNPVRTTTTVSHPQARRNASLQVLSVEGKTLLFVSVEASSQNTEIDLSKFTKGNYVIVFRNGAERIVKQVVKQ